MGRSYVPALGRRWLDRLYDPLIRWTMPEREFKTALIGQARLEGSPLVLDLGCGTGTLMLMLKQRHPEARIVGLDGDDLIVSLAREKLRRSSVEVSLAVALADAAPFAAAQFDRVLTTLVLHHLDSETKKRALKEAFRVLRPGGELHIADWGRPHNALMRPMSTLVRAFDGYGVTRDNLDGRIPLCRDAGFIDVAAPRRRATLFGTLSFYRARKPES